jgi:hypothetical protein
LAVNKDEMRRIMSLMDEIAKFIPTLVDDDGDYINVFEPENSLYVVDQNADGYCAFSYKGRDGSVKCAVHSAIVSLGLDLKTYKPRVCNMWPLTEHRERGNIIYLDIDTQQPFPCLTRKKKQNNSIDPSIRELLSFAIGKTNVLRLEEYL